MGDELKQWKVRWPTDLESTKLPSELTRCVDSNKVKKYWSVPLSNWPVSAFASDKMLLSHLLAAARRSMFEHDHQVSQPEGDHDRVA